MRIATMVRGYLPVPRPEDIVYAPIDLALDIAYGLKEKGHKVDFYAPGGGKLKVPLKSGGLVPLINNNKEWVDFLNNPNERTRYMTVLWDYYLAKYMFEEASKGKYDLLHFHHPELPLTFASLYPNVPFITTLHDPLNDWYDLLFKLYESPNQYFISISDNQRKPHPELNYVATVYNGVYTNDFIPNGAKRSFLLFVGRIVPEKGVKEAVEIAQRTKRDLVIIGPLLPENQAYFDKYIKPHLNKHIRYEGFVERKDLLWYYQSAEALLMPLSWEEPFGMNMIEAMSCGTPVVALKRGSVPEVVVNNKTGYICRNVDEMVQAVMGIGKIKRADCRQHVINKFSTEKMVNGYEQAFKLVLKELP